MKKIISLLVVLALCLCLCSCGKADDYDAAMALMDSGNYEGAIAAFTELGDYEDSIQKTEECHSILSYKDATALFDAERYEDALDIFSSLGDFKDSAEMAKECVYQKAQLLIEQKEYSLALIELENISEYKDSDSLIELANNWLTYEKGNELLHENNYKKAYELFNEIRGFQDVDSILLHFSPQRMLLSENYTVFDNLGNSRTANIMYEYNDKGQLVSAKTPQGNQLVHFSRKPQSFANIPYNFSNASCEIYEYNEDGTVSSITGTYGSDKAYVVLFKYDENGRIEYEDATTNTDEAKCYYIYNDKGQLTGVRLDRNDSPIMKYSYDNSGKLVKAESTAFGRMFTMNYIYDCDTLISRDVSIIGDDWLSEHYTYNNDGELEKIEYEYADSTNGHVEIKFKYKDYIFYNGE